MKTRLIAAILLCAAALPGWTREAAPAAADPQLEKRVMRLAEELRCLVCQNQTIADSNAPLALDLREQIREQFRSGKSEQDVIDFMVARYGDFVLYRPPVKMTTVMLWFGPALLIIAGLAALFVRLARRRRDAPELSREERARAAAMLAGDSDTEKR